MSERSMLLIERRLYVLQLSSSSPVEQSLCPSHSHARSKHLPSLHR